MKFFCVTSIVIVCLYTNISANPPKGGIGDGDGYIYPVKQAPSKPKTTTTYYAKPLHPPMKKMSSPAKYKPEVFKVIIQDHGAQMQQPRKKEQIFKIIHLPKNGGHSGGSKSVKIFKIVHVKQPKGGHHGGGWSK